MGWLEAHTSARIIPMQLRAFSMKVLLVFLESRISVLSNSRLSLFKAQVCLWAQNSIKLPLFRLRATARPCTTPFQCGMMPAYACTLEHQSPGRVLQKSVCFTQLHCRNDLLSQSPLQQHRCLLKQYYQKGHMASCNVSK